MDKEAQIAIEQAKRNISDLINRVAYGGERVILTCEGRPKAVLVSLADLQQLRGRDREQRRSAWQEWLTKSARINQVILAETRCLHPDIDQLLEAARADLEEKAARFSGGDS